VCLIWYSALGFDNWTANILSGNYIPIHVDSTITGWVDQEAGTWGVSSTQLFYDLLWTASGGSLVMDAGDYALDTTTGAVAPAAPDYSTITWDGSMHFTVGAGQVAGIIDWAWGNYIIRVVNVWNVNADGSLTASRVPGMENGPFPGFNAAFNFTAADLYNPVPEPASMLLVGSGLAGLVGLVRQRK